MVCDNKQLKFIKEPEASEILWSARIKIRLSESISVGPIF